MLKIWFGYTEESLGSPRLFFNGAFRKSYLEDDYAKKVVLAVDKSKVISQNLIESPVLGAIPPSMLSNGVKSLLVAMYYPSIMVNFANMGRNCVPFLCKLAMDRDVLVCADCFYIPYNYGYMGDILVLNDNTIIKDDDGYVDKWIELIEDEREVDGG